MTAPVDTHEHLDGFALLCPACGFFYSHIREVYTALGSDEHEAGVYKGTDIGGVTPSRRSALVVVVDGECGHTWDFVIQQHKGVNYVSTENVVEQEPA